MNNRRPQRYCRDCHAAYMRGWRENLRAETEALKAKEREFLGWLAVAAERWAKKRRRRPVGKF
jgi:hypothetical protein